MEHQGFSLGSISKGDTQKWNSLLRNLLDHSARFAQCFDHTEDSGCTAGPAVAVATDPVAELEVVATGLVVVVAQPAVRLASEMVDFPLERLLVRQS